MDKNREQFEENIRKDLEEHNKLMREVSGTIFSHLRANISQYRNMMTHIAIIAGALASFSLFVFNYSHGDSRILLILAIIILLGIIWLALYSLQSSLDAEFSEFMELLNHFSEMGSELKQNLINLLRDENVKNYKKRVEEIKEKFKPTQKKKPKIEIRGNIHKIIIRIAFPFALILIALSLLSMR